MLLSSRENNYCEKKGTIMNNGDVHQKTVEVFARILGVDPATISVETSPANVAEWDSLAHVQLILELEKAFNIQISPDQAMEFENFKMITDWISVQV
jgi:acyl carrier protein